MSKLLLNKKSDLIKEVKLTLYSPEKILKDSFGKVVSPKTFTKSWREELGGLFDPRIFGPSSDYECYCGKYQGIKNKNQKCDQCDVLVTSNRIRRWRMGHISLNSSVTNILVLRGIISKLSKIIGISSEDIESIIYCDRYVVIDKGNSLVVEEKQILDKRVNYSVLSEILNEMLASEKFAQDKRKTKEIESLIENLDTDTSKVKRPLEFRIVFVEDYLEFLDKNWGVKIETGSQAFQKVLKKINLQDELNKLIESKDSGKKNSSNIDSLNERIRFVKALIKNGVRLEDMVITELPVIPSGIRPATKLEDDNSIATTQINNLYRGVILANNRLQSYKELNSRKDGKIFFADIIHNEMRRLQKSVDKLFQGGNQIKTDDANVKSLIQILSGKEGIPRKHSLGKRVDYSARSVIVPNPALRIDQVGLPIRMALTLYRPFLIRELLDIDLATNVKEANLLIEKGDESIFSILRDISKDHPVILNRAPTLHKLGMQGFYPVLTLGKSIQLHPLVTTAFNADFDGDQMAVHLPLSDTSIEEVKNIVIASNNIINPQNNNLIDVPSQDMILGIYYLTSEIKSNDKVKIYYSVSDMIRDYENQLIDVREVLIVPTVILGKNFSEKFNQFTFTTLGKVLINRIIPDNFPWYVSNLTSFIEKGVVSEENTFFLSKDSRSFEEEFSNFNPSNGWKKKEVIQFLNKLLPFFTIKKMANFLDELKDIGFEFATKSGLTISLFDIPELENRSSNFSEAYDKISKIESYKEKGFYTEQESYEKKIEAWTDCKNKMEEELLSKINVSKKSSLYSIWDSGARASTENLMQIFAMRGNMTNYRGEIIETAITSSLWEGLTQFEFVISVYGMIKGMIDIAVKTAVAGHFSRMLVECVQNIVVKSDDCETERGTSFSSLTELDQVTGERIVLIPLEKRVYGRFLSKDLVNKEGELILKRNTLLLDDEISKLKYNKVEEVFVRTSFECEIFPAICKKCYGLDLSKIKEVVSLGAAVGITAAQSLGEPGTQLTMRTFHSGGVASQQGDIVQGLPKVKEILENISPSKENKAVISKLSGVIKNIVVDSESTKVTQEQENSSNIMIYSLSGSRIPLIREGQFVEKGQMIGFGKIDLVEYLDNFGRDASQEYIKKEIWKVYSTQGIEINEKHIEMFIRQMMSKVEILEDYEEYVSGDILNYRDIVKINQSREILGLDPLKSKQILLGIKKVPGYFPSFLSNISFQNTSKSLIDYTMFQPSDKLEGVKENMIIGQLVPVGTGYEARSNLKDKEKTISY